MSTVPLTLTGDWTNQHAEFLATCSNLVQQHVITDAVLDLATVFLHYR